jgi:imidazolonepropionase-like amidohydrolase
MSFVPRFAVDPASRRRTMAPPEEYNHFEIAEDCKELADRGVLVQLGAHGQREGLGAHWELWMFGQGGMTPMEALRVATLNGAKYLGLDGDLGSIETGKLADLIVLEKDPLEDLRNSESVVYTMVGGRLYDARTLDQLGNHPEERGKLFWEE